MDQPANPSETRAEASEANGAPAAADEIATLKEQLEAKDKKIDELLRAYASEKNEQHEFRARLQRERDRLIDLERGKVATAFLEAADELDRAIRAAGDDESPLMQGVRLCRESMSRKMAGMGIEPLNLVGKPFDPNVSEAVDLVAVDDRARDGIVIDEPLAGYTIGGKLLRAARVRVGKHLPATSPTERANVE